MMYLIKYLKTQINEHHIPTIIEEKEEDINASDSNEVIMIFNNKFVSTENIYYSINKIIKLQEFLVCYTNVWLDPDFSYCDMSDELIYALNKEDAKRRFYLQFPNTEYTKNYIDKIFNKEEFAIEYNKNNDN